MTPLVDVVLVLLIIFMVITPALHEGAALELPTVTTPDAKPKDLDPIEVTLTADGAIMLERETLDRAELEARLAALREADAERKLLLKADAALPYVAVRDTFSALQRLGFPGLSLKVTEKKPEVTGGG